MTARGPYTADKDAWVAQLVGGTTQYGNGTGGLIHAGPVPQAGGGADFKSRGIFEISAADVTSFMADATSIDNATITLIVGGNSCLGSRGSTIRLFLEEMTTDFGEKSTSGDCILGSGSGGGVWGISNNFTAANRASYSGSPGLGASVTFDVTALFEARRAAGNITSVFRFRVISANSALTDYDETTASRRISFYSREDATSGNRPSLSGNVTTGNVQKSTSDSIAITDAFSFTQSGTSPSTQDTITVTDTWSGGPIPGWTTAIDTSGNGHAVLYTPSVPTVAARAYLASVSQQDVTLRCRIQFDKVPLNGSAQFMLMTRYSRSPETFYQVRMVVGGSLHSISLYLDKIVAGVVIPIISAGDIRAFLAGQEYWLEMACIGVSPTTFSGKVWRFGDSEPNWILQTTDSEATLQDAGAVGMAGFVSDTVTNAPLTMMMEQLEAF